MPANTDTMKQGNAIAIGLSLQEDEQLMVAVTGGNKEAFSELASRYLNQIIQFAYRYVGNRSDAEDVAQETLIRLWKHAVSWEPQGYSLKSWLYRITYNLCIDDIRKRKPVSELKYDNQAVATEQPEKEVYDDEKQSLVFEALNALPERQRTAINLCVYQALSNQDAANVMGVSVDALESLLSRGRRNLRKDLKDKEDSGKV